MQIVNPDGHTPQRAAWQPISQLPPALALRQLMFGHRVTRIITVAAQLRLADAMDDTPRSVAALAAAVGTDTAALHRLLYALASIGLVTVSAPDQFVLTPVGACLRSDAPHGLRSWALMESAEYYQTAWDHLLTSVRSGAPAFEGAVGQSFYDYLDRHPVDGANFNQTMGEVTTVIVDAVLTAYDFASVEQVVDVGGGYGKLLTSLLQRYPTMRGVLLDTPAVIERARPQVQAAGVADRCELVGGDFFADLPAGGDLYLLSRILMDHDDEGSVRLLRNCRRVMTERGRVHIIQIVLPPPDADAAHHLLFDGAMSNLNMFVLGLGAERTEEQYRALLARAGLAVTQIIPTRALMSIIEARSADRIEIPEHSI
ncbi:MAG TPA: methyltransferase [Kofleriaceae bacterium]